MQDKWSKQEVIPLQLVYIGSWDVYKSPGSVGLAICSWDADGGTLSLLDQALPGVSAGAMCLHPSGSLLYCTDESAHLAEYFRGGGGQVYALQVEESGALTEVNHSPSFGSLPSYVCLDSAGEYLVVTHHTGREPVTQVAGESEGEYRIELAYDVATTVLFPLNRDGSIAPPCDVYRHTGNGGPLPRQTHPQLHSINRSPSSNIFVVCDKGNDELIVFSVDYAARRLKVCGSPVKTPPGSSPRYVAFHPVDPYLFVNHETSAVVTSYRYDPSGSLQPVCTIDVLPPDFPRASEAKQSDIKVHPSGSFLYTLIRGLDLLTVFAIKVGTGNLQRIQTVSLLGEGPRGCALSPDGRFILIAMHTSNEVIFGSIANDGTVTLLQRKMAWRNPGTILFA